MYKVHVEDRNYTSWKFYHVETFQEEVHFSQDVPPIIPLDHKLFTSDCFTLDPETKKLTITSSPTRKSSNQIPGILELKSGKTFGRDAKNGKLLYKVVPNDRRIPAFLVPYKIKELGFSKVLTNIYVMFVFDCWTDKHPQGIISQVIGPVDVLVNFYEYQLYCKQLNVSIQSFTKDANNSIKKAPAEAYVSSIMKKHPEIEDRTDSAVWNIFTIDPPKSIDYDDGFSVKSVEHGGKTGFSLVSIYISNVTIWMDVLNLWDSFSRRISTIYLPDRKRPMLPTILSDNLCSLQENTTRFAFVMDVVVCLENGEIADIKYSNCAIRVKKNYSYEEPSLLMSGNYQQLMEVTELLAKKYKYIKHVRDSHELVTYLMIFMNFQCAQKLLENKNGLFRSTVLSKKYAIEKATFETSPEIATLPEEVGKFIQIWNSNIGGKYINAALVEEIGRHALLDMDAYIHVTSPIRRLVDLLNIIQIQKNLKMLTLSYRAAAFYQKWTTASELEYINTTMRSIRKVQNECCLLEMCATNPEKLNALYEAYVFDRVEKTDQMEGLFQYFVYLPDIKFVTRFKTRELFENYTKCQFKLYMFTDEESLKKKIRLQLVV